LKLGIVDEVLKEPSGGHFLMYLPPEEEPNYSHQRVLLIPRQQSLVSKDLVL
jgi:hypothetical protein